MHYCIFNSMFGFIGILDSESDGRAKLKKSQFSTDIESASTDTEKVKSRKRRARTFSSSDEDVCLQDVAKRLPDIKRPEKCKFDILIL